MRDRLTGAAMQGSAYSARPTPRLAADQVRDLDSNVRARMNRVQVTGTDFVTLSGGSGTLVVTLVNGLAQPIDVGLRTRTDSADVKVESADPVELGPGQRTTLRLAVHSRAGLHEVTMVPVTEGGQVAGQPFTFSLRTSQVGQVLWYVIAAGCLLLAVMVVRRIVIRIRSRRWRRGGTGMSGPGGERPGAGQAGAGQDAAASKSLLTSSAVMAAGTVVSRMSGFVRTILLAAALGVGLHADVFNIANTVPNMLYILLAGGVVNAVLVPQLVRAGRNDPDGGAAYTSRIITLAGVFLVVVTILLVIFAPSPDERCSSTAASSIPRAPTSWTR